MLTTTISAGYYLYVVMVMFMRPRPEGALPLPRITPLSQAVIVGSAVLLLVFGVFPDPIVRWSRGGGTLTQAPPETAVTPAPAP